MGGLRTYDRGHAHGRTGVARVGLEGGVHLGGESACVLVVVLEGSGAARSEAEQQIEPLHWGVSQQTYRKSADGVDSEGVNLVVAHLCGIVRWICVG